MPLERFEFLAVFQAEDKIVLKPDRNRGLLYRWRGFCRRRITPNQPGQRLMGSLDQPRKIGGGDMITLHIGGDDLGGPREAQVILVLSPTLPACPVSV